MSKNRKYDLQETDELVAILLNPLDKQCAAFVD